MATQGRQLDKPTIEAIIADYMVTNSYLATAKKYGLSHVTVGKYVARHMSDDDFNTYCQEQKKDMAARLWQAMGEALDTCRSKIGSASVGQVNAFFGTVADKLFLLTGQATSIVENRGVSWQFQVRSDGSLSCEQKSQQKPQETKSEVV